MRQILPIVVLSIFVGCSNEQTNMLNCDPRPIGLLTLNRKDVDYYFTIEVVNGRVCLVKIRTLMCSDHGDEYVEDHPGFNGACPVCGEKSSPVNKLFCKQCQTYTGSIPVGSPDEAYVCPVCHRNLLESIPAK